MGGTLGIGERGRAGSSLRLASPLYYCDVALSLLDHKKWCGTYTLILDSENVLQNLGCKLLKVVTSIDPDVPHSYYGIIPLHFTPW